MLVLAFYLNMNQTFSGSALTHRLQEPHLGPAFSAALRRMMETVSSAGNCSHAWTQGPHRLKSAGGVQHPVTPLRSCDPPLGTSMCVPWTQTELSLSTQDYNVEHKSPNRKSAMQPKPEQFIKKSLNHLLISLNHPLFVPPKSSYWALIVLRVV